MSFVKQWDVVGRGCIFLDLFDINSNEMAKEVVVGGAVGVQDDDGPEEGEIEDDTSEDDTTEKNEFRSSTSTDVSASVGRKYYQPTSSTKSESRIMKSKVYSEDKKESWRSSKRRIYKFYVDHDKPSRDPYNRVMKSDANSDRRGINFHELLKEYKTSKHGNEGKLTVSPDTICHGNSHEKENSHYTKEVRVDSSRKRESGVSETQEDKVKRSRKRKHHKSPSRSPVSSDTDVPRKRKDLRGTRQKKKKKIPAGVRNLSESAALFAQIRASKLNSEAAAGQQKPQVEVINVPSEGENPTEVSETCLANLKSLTSEGDDGKSADFQSVEEDGESHRNESLKYDSNKSLCSASDAQAAEKNEDSESKDEEDVNQLRMIALQSAFKAKYLERKRRGFTVRKQGRRTSSHISPKVSDLEAKFSLDDTADLLEAAAEEAVLSSVSKEIQPSPLDNWQPTLSTSLSEVPLPPDDPPMQCPVEDLTPVDMELALTDVEDGDNTCENDKIGLQSEHPEIYHPKVRISHSSSKSRSIPVAIGGRIQSFKSRQRNSNSNDSARINLLEVRTCSDEGQCVQELDSSFISMADVNVNSMILLDEVGTCSSPEVCPGVEEDQASEASDAKSDLVQYSGNQGCMSGNDIDDEDEELLRARLLVEISRRHRKQNMVLDPPVAKEVKINDSEIINSSFHEIVPMQTATEDIQPVMRLNGKNTASHNAAVHGIRFKGPLKRTVERARRGQLLAKVRSRQGGVSANGQMTVSPYVKSYLSKISSRGKYQRVNQNRIVAKKRIDGNIHVTVVGAGGKAKSVSRPPQKQGRIVICLGEDSDESDDDRQSALSKRVPLRSNVVHLHEQSLANSGESPELVALGSGIPQQTSLGSHFPSSNVSIDFEKSVDLFLKEVRSGQELRSQSQPLPGRGEHAEKEETKPKQAVTPKVTSKIHTATPTVKVNSKVNTILSATKRNLKESALSLAPKPVFRTHAISSVSTVNMKANVISEAAKAAGNTPLVNSTKNVLKAASGVTPQAVRHLPAKQQEEYRRLKMQISVLEELHKKRKAAKASHLLRSRSIVQGQRSATADNTRKLSVLSGSMQESKAEEVGVEGSSGMSQDLSIKIKDSASAKVGRDTSGVSNNSDDEDVNLMREQLLKSQLHKKIGAQTEISAVKPEICTVTTETFCSVENADSKPVGSPSRLCEHGSSPPKENPTSEVTVAPSVSSVSPSAAEVAGSEGVPLKVKETAMCSAPPHEVTAVVRDSCTEATANDSVKGDEVEGEASEERVLSWGSDCIGEQSQVAESVPLVEKDPVSRAEAAGHMGDKSTGAEASPSGKEDLKAGPGLKVSGTGDLKQVVMESLPHGSSRSVVGASCALPLYSLQSNDTRATELAEMELQLLSERHAALKYLSELSKLLTEMERNGAHLRQKEITAEKLRADLASAESAIAAQKDFLKQLALNISTTHERVMSTRQRCSMFSRACIRLGNQIKQNKRMGGGGAYQVPTGGAALVKSQLSNVLWQTKQLKKAGFSFLRGQNFVTSAKCPTAKRSLRQGVNTCGETRVVPWSILALQSLEGLHVSAAEGKSSHSSKPFAENSTTFANTVPNFPVKKIAFTVSTSSESKTARGVGLIESNTRKISPASESVLAPGKFVLSPLSKVTTASLPSSQSAKVKGDSVVEEKLLSEVCSSTFRSVPLSGDSVVGGEGDGEPAACPAELPGLGEAPHSAESTVRKGVQLRDYHSPLEPIPKRVNSENLATSSESSSHQENSVVLDPNIILCPYDLMGECQDEECVYQHQGRKRGTVKES